MTKDLQTTVATAVDISGPGLHSGEQCRLTIVPAPADAGIVWQRTDLPGAAVVPATVANVVSTERATTIGLDDAVQVRTIEHVMAALAGLRVDNALIQVDAVEPPFADGAAQQFVQLIRRAGIVPLDAPRRTRGLSGPVAVSRGDAHIVALPARQLTISYTFVSDHPALGTQFAEYALTPDVFARDVAPARTVGWLAEVQALQERGLALGVTSDAAVVVDEDKLVAPMKFPNEVARHKLLDIVGDLALIGPFAAHIIALRSGHALHVELARRLDVFLTEEETDVQ